MQYYLAIKRNEVPQHRCSERERSQTQKVTYYMIPFIWNVQNREIHTDRKQLSGPRDGEMKKWEGTFNVYMVSFEGDEKVSEQDRGDGYILKRY